jgi:chromosome segregation ATPase
LEQRADAIAERVRELDAEIDARAATHESTCAPIQADLAAAEAEIATKLADRSPVPPALEKRRVEAIASIDEANGSLATGVDEIKKKRARLAEEEEKLRFEIASQCTLEDSLSRPPLSNPNLLLRLFLAQRVEQFAVQRKNVAMAMIEDRIRPPAPGITWQVELRAATEAVEAARIATAAAHQALVDE